MILEQAKKDRDLDTAQERLGRWRTRTEESLSEYMHADIVENWKIMLIKSPFSIHRTVDANADEGEMWDRFLASLLSDLVGDPEGVLLTPVSIQMAEGTHVLQALSFDFVATEELRLIAERDKTELVTACRNGLWKSAILLCGGLAEAILCDKLHEGEQEAQAKYKELWPKKRPGDLLEWDLYELTTVAENLGEIRSDAARLANTLRGWRNLVHPGKEARGDIKPEQEEADLAVHMIMLLARDLSRGKPSVGE